MWSRDTRGTDGAPSSATAVPMKDNRRARPGSGAPVSGGGSPRAPVRSAAPRAVTTSRRHVVRRDLETVPVRIGEVERVRGRVVLEGRGDAALLQVAARPLERRAVDAEGDV